jgi:hypothetical protein
MVSNLWEDKLSEVMSYDAPVEEFESEGTFPMDLVVYWGNATVGLLLALAELRYQGSLSKPKTCHLLSFTHVFSTRCIKGVSLEIA